MLHQRALRESQTDRVLREGSTIGRDSMRVLRQYPSGQRNIGRDDDISSNDLLCDPIVGRVGSGTDDDPGDQR